MNLVRYERNFKDKIDNYNLSEEQLQYTGTPSNAIELVNIDSNRHAILAINNNNLVSFFVLHENEGVKPYSENANAILLRTFSTDYRHQGKSYAKHSLLLLPKFVKEHFQHINEIVLAVNVNNLAAQTLYEKCGFIDAGIRKMGKKGELIIMSYYL